MSTKSLNIVLILNNIRSNENVGSIFRTADAAGVPKIYLCGYTPTPVDEFGRVNKALAKTGLGAERFVEWERVKSLKSASEKLRKEGFKVVAVEQNKKSVNYKKLNKLAPSSSRLALAFGNEVKGLSKKDLSFCDKIIEIPMKGHKESLNVAVAVGIILFSVLDNSSPPPVGR